MGQQQLLLLVLAVIIIGTAVLFAMGLFRGAAVESKRDLLISESTNIASHALGYYKRPREMNGGGNSFQGWQIPAMMQTTEAGSYVANVTDQEVTITGTGTEVVGIDTIKVETVVSDSGFHSIIIH